MSDRQMENHRQRSGIQRVPGEKKEVQCGRSLEWREGVLQDETEEAWQGQDCMWP